ncbi:hypothetical protein Talka_00186 [Tepidimonas alkaliphilus]|uniref:Uncharacterized protein n=1 Tax=Tepidimonas alkaliphilus TaxID=2588942 RepID=A0A554WD44_9BURK|nr:hypothetical protein [Tepidimonas alkaliphilus]TSE21511.1 hypothetical protein Talka_00186 [Tepidimonas alkaliphilus]
MGAHRQPPALVPTLTDMVEPAPEPTAEAATALLNGSAGPLQPCQAEAALTSLTFDEAALDEVVERVLARLQPHLQQQLQAAWARWLQQRLAEEGPALHQALLRELAGSLRAELTRIGREALANRGGLHGQHDPK